MTDAQDVVLYEKRNRIAYVTLNRPEAMNALNSAVGARLYEIWNDFRDDDDLLVAIITGAGGRAFSAGADLKEVSGRQAEGLSQFSEREAGSRFIPDLNVWKPIISAIDGFCVAGGLELAMQTDIRIATEKSQFGLPEPRWSIMPAYGLHHMMRMIPTGDALRMMLTGSRINTEVALRNGLIQEVYPDRDALMAAAEGIAEEVKLCAPMAVQAIKQIAYVGRNMPPEYSYRFAQELSAKVLGSEDAAVGPAAFAERRTPEWKGR